VAFLTGLTFTLYWADAPTLVGEFLTGAAPFAAYATSGFLTATTFVMAGLMREQVCTYMCPYARFQSAMFDRDTLIISYDPRRGERTAGRAKLGRDLKTRDERMAAGVGDCVDCGYCVQVCPVGIDIRNGLQYECIACGACIDACDDVMDKMGMPHGLIRYTTQHALDGQAVHVVRPRILVYSLLLAALVSAWVWGVFHRSPLIADVLRDRNALYQQQGDHIANGYTLKLVNKTDADHVYKVSIDGTGTLALTLKGGPLQVRVPAGQVVAQAVEVGSDAPVTGRHDLRFVIEASDGSSKAQVDSTFFGPM